MRLAAMAMLVSVAGGADLPDRNVTVYMRKGNVPLGIRSQAQGWSQKMLAQAGVRLAWRDGPPPRNPPAQPIVVELAVNTPPEFLPEALAQARVFEGVHITVFYDRVAEKGSPGAVLAHVLAHEIAHILQGVDRHSSTGIMKGAWTKEDFTQMRYKPLLFTEEDIRLIHQGLDARESRTQTSTRQPKFDQ